MTTAISSKYLVLQERAFILGRMDACLSVTAIFGFALAAPTFEFFTGWSDSWSD